MKAQKKCIQKAARILALLLVVIMLSATNGFTVLAQTVSENQGVPEGRLSSSPDSDGKAPVDAGTKVNANELAAAEAGSSSEEAVKDRTKSGEAAETETEPEASAETDMRSEAAAEAGTEMQTEAESLDAAQAAEPSDPVHDCTKENDGSDCTDWSYVYFGSYPQSKVTDAATISAIDSAITSSGISGDAGIDVWVNGLKYRRISKSDTNNDYYFGDRTYRYFKWERIKWKVLSNDGTTLFVVADKGLDCKNYNETYTAAVTWETCTLRSWLNNPFCNTAFSAEEQSAIVAQTVVNNDNPSSTRTEGGNDTNDKVYLLSIEEVTKPAYGFCEDTDTWSASRRFLTSDYSHARGAWRDISVGYEGNCWWWLRSPGYHSYSAAGVYDSGLVDRDGNYVDYTSAAVFPALHINLSSDLWSMSDDGTSGAGGEIHKVSIPQASILGGTFQDTQRVALSTATAGADIYYTIDGTEPSGTNGTKYNGTELTISDTVTLKAIAVKAGMDDSDVMTETYNFTVTKQNEESSKETEAEGKAQESGKGNENVPDGRQQDSKETGIKLTKLSVKAPSKKLAAGKAVQLTVEVTPSNAAKPSVTWKVSNTKYASITKTGKLTLKAAGAGKTVTVTAAAKDGSNLSASCKIEIMQNAVTKVQIKQGSKTLKSGKTITGKAGSSVKLKAAVTMTDKKGKVKSDYKANKTVTWTSFNTKYATVNQSGKVKLLKAGRGKTVTITAAATDGSGKKAKVKIRIK